MSPYFPENTHGSTDTDDGPSEVQTGTSGIPKKPLPFFLEAAKRIEGAGYGAGWINKNVDISEPETFFIKPKNRFGYRSGCPHFQGVWLCGGFMSIKCAVCPIPVPGLHLDLTCAKDYEHCPFYNGESIEDYDVR